MSTESTEQPGAADALEKLAEALGNAPPEWREHFSMQYSDEQVVTQCIIGVANRRHHQGCMAHAALLGYRSRDAEVAELKSQITQHYRSFDGHVYVKNEEYSTLCAEVKRLRVFKKTLEELEPEIVHEWDNDHHDPISGFFCAWNELIRAMPEDLRIGGYSESPMEMVFRLTDQRDDARDRITKLEDGILKLRDLADKREDSALDAILAELTPKSND